MPTAPLAMPAPTDSFILYYLPVLGYSKLAVRTFRRERRGQAARQQEQRQTWPQAQYRGRARGVLSADLQTRHGPALEGHELGRDQGTGHALRAACLAL